MLLLLKVNGRSRVKSSVKNYHFTAAMIRFLGYTRLCLHSYMITIPTSATFGIMQNHSEFNILYTSQIYFIYFNIYIKIYV